MQTSSLCAAVRLWVAGEGWEATATLAASSCSMLLLMLPVLCVTCLGAAGLASLPYAMQAPS